MKFVDIEIKPEIVAKIDGGQDWEKLLREEIDAYCKEQVGKPIDAQMRQGLRNTIINFMTRNGLVVPEDLTEYKIDCVISDDEPRTVTINAELI